MSELIKHECGIALIRLRKPLEFYKEKYGTWQYGLNKLYLLMEKQHNRGQDGAGIVNVKMELDPGQEYINRHRSIEPNPRKLPKELKKRRKINQKVLISDGSMKMYHFRAKYILAICVTVLSDGTASNLFIR